MDNKWIFPNIIQYLNYKDCYSLMKVCKGFYEESLWEHVCTMLIQKKWRDHKTQDQKWPSFYLEASFSLGDPTIITPRLLQQDDVFPQATFSEYWIYIKNGKEYKHRSLDLPAQIRTTVGINMYGSYEYHFNNEKTWWFWHGMCFRKNGSHTQQSAEIEWEYSYLDELNGTERANECDVYKYRNREGNLHSVNNNPAVIKIRNGYKVFQGWYNNGKMVRGVVRSDEDNSDEQELLCGT
jgi:hypothetical protein